MKELTSTTEIRKAINAKLELDQAKGSVYMAVGDLVFDRTGREVDSVIGWGYTPEQAMLNNPEYEYVAVVIVPNDDDYTLVAQNERKMIAIAYEVLRHG